jgi:hypothetical protein
MQAAQHVRGELTDSLRLVNRRARRLTTSSSMTPSRARKGTGLMLVVVSDLHITDRDAGAPVSDAELTKFVGEIAGLDPGEPMTLLLLGDILDLLRSDQAGRAPASSRWQPPCARSAAP